MNSHGSSNTPTVLEKNEPVAITKVIGNFRCSGKGNIIDPFVKPCKSLLQLTWENIYIRHLLHKSKLTFICPVCQNETDISYRHYRPQQPKGLVLPTRTEYLKRIE